MILVSIAVASSAAAVDRVWLGPTGLPPGDGTSFDDPLNWLPNGVPIAIDTAIFDGIGGDVLFGSAFTNNERAIMRGLTPPTRFLLDGHVYFLNATDDSGADRSLVLAPDPGDEVELDVEDGVLIAGHAAIGAASGSSATFKLSTGTTMLFTGVSVFGESGAATVEASDGSVIINADDAFAARLPGSSAVLLLENLGTSWSVSGSLHLGGDGIGDGGAANAMLADGALLSINGELHLHPEAELSVLASELEVPRLVARDALTTFGPGAMVSITDGAPARRIGAVVGGSGAGEMALSEGARVVAEDVELADDGLLALDAARLETAAFTMGAGASIEATFAPASKRPGDQALIAASGSASLSGRVALSTAAEQPLLGSSIDVVTSPAVEGEFLVTTVPLLGGLNYIDLSVETGAPANVVGVDSRVVAEVKTLDLRLAVRPPTTSPLPAPPNLLSVAPFGGDPTLVDAAVTIPGLSSRDSAAHLLVLTNTLPEPGGQPGFIETTSIRIGGDPRGLGNADFTGDGKNDIAVSSRGDDTVTIVHNVESPAKTSVGPPFEISQIIDVGGQVGGLGIGDIDGVNGPDVVVAQFEISSFTLLINDGAGLFAAGSTVPAGTGTQGVNPTDLDDDKDIDIVCMCVGTPGEPGTATVTVHVNPMPPGGPFKSFQPFVSYPVGLDPVALATGDLNGDGSLEIVTANEGDGTISLLVNRGDGTFEPAIALDAGGSPTALALIDLDDDEAGDLDIALIVDDAGTPSLTLFRNDTVGDFLVLVPIFDAQSVFGIPAALAGGDATGEGPADLIFTGAGAPPLADGPPTGAISVNVSMPISCLGSFDGDDVVDGSDLAVVLGSWGPAIGSPADLNGDGVVNSDDLTILLAQWGRCR